MIGEFFGKGAIRGAVLALVVMSATAGNSKAHPLRVAIATDALTMDPDALNAGPTSLILRQIYEPLVGRGRDDYGKVPSLALSWHQQLPRLWRFVLRAGVHFHDGSPFDADDVVFSLLRAQSGFSDFKLYTSGVTEVRKIDALTVDILTAEPDPLLPDKLSRVFMMDSGWAERHGVAHPQSPTLDKSSFTALHANGTGPYKLVGREPGGKTELERNPVWWDDNQSSVDRVDFIPMTSDGSRVAALLAGDIDLVVDVPPQLIRRIADGSATKIIEGTENRTIFLGMDVKRDSLIYGDVKDRNPLKDRNVRRALYLAIDTDAIRKGLMQGHSVPAGLLWAPSVFGYTKDDDTRPPPDPRHARQLLAEAGYPSGFGVMLDCPTGRYVNDVEICQAVASQLARVGVRVHVNALPFALWVSKLRAFDTSFYLIGWGAPTFDALFTLQAIVHSRGEGADGSNNFGGYSNPAVDSLIDQLKTESDQAKRLLLIRRAARLEREDVGYVPLHHQTIIWGMRKGIDAVLPPENQLDLKWIRSVERFQ